MANAFFGERTITGAAAALTVDARIRAAPGTNQAPAYVGSGIGVAFEFYADKDIYVSAYSGVTDTGGGGVLPAGTPFPLYATGLLGNAADPTLWYVYAAADTTLTVLFVGM